MGWREQIRRRRRSARNVYADPAFDLEAKARQAWRRGFAGGAEWMRAALGAVRGGCAPQGCARFGVLGVKKYAACCGAASVAAAALWWSGAGALAAAVGAVVLFYAVEVQFVFLFPLALDHGDPAWRRARRLMVCEGGTVRAFVTVVPIAMRMLAGGLRGWCCGCLEVLLWYEDARTKPRAARETRALVVGEGEPLDVRVETVPVRGLERRLRLAWISDLHFCRRASLRTVRATILAVRKLQPDVIVLGGDLVDSEVGLSLLARLVRMLTQVAPVWALPGNHDERFGSARVAATVRAMGGAWLPGVTGAMGDSGFVLVAGEHAHEGAGTENTIVCLHAPARAARWRGRARVVLAGHLHGGQFVFARAFRRWWPCALFYRWCGPRFEMGGGTTLIVSAGAGDLLPVRWNCPREIVAVDLLPISGAGRISGDEHDR